MFIIRTTATLGLATLAAASFGGGSPVAANAAAAAAGETVPQRRDSHFAVGDLFPDLAFPSLADGTPARLSDFRGKKVMLHVFASW